MVRFGPERFSDLTQTLLERFAELTPLGTSDDGSQRFAKQAIEVMTDHRLVMAPLLKQKAGHGRLHQPVLVPLRDPLGIGFPHSRAHPLTQAPATSDLQRF